MVNGTPLSGQRRVRQSQEAVSAAITDFLLSCIRTYSYIPKAHFYRRRSAVYMARFMCHVALCLFAVMVASAVAIFCAGRVLFEKGISKIVAFANRIRSPHEPDPIGLVPREKSPRLSTRPPVPHIRIDVKTGNRRKPPGAARADFSDNL